MSGGLLIIFLHFRGTISVIDFVRELRKLFKSNQEKESLFTEIRELIHSPDLADYDRLVYQGTDNMNMK